MGSKTIRKINQNILFDISFLFQQNNIYTAGPIDCIMIAHHMMYPDFPKGLDFLCSNYTREPYYKDDGKLWSKPWANMENFWEYNCKDSACAFEVAEGLNGDGILTEIKKEGHRPTYDDTIALFRPLMYMMVHGLRVDADRLAETRVEAKALLAQREADLRAVAEWDFNPASPKQCQEYFYVTKGFKPYTSLKTGGVTTDDKAMARIAKRHKLPEARLVQEIRGLRKLISSYLEVKYDEDQRIRCSYNPRGTTTGRLSSGETVFGSGMNFCNLDPRFKDFLVADPVDE
jgi:DNA polymerase I-like protein with 3'-5' exonuclease and polymerase domains